MLNSKFCLLALLASTKNSININMKNFIVKALKLLKKRIRKFTRGIKPRNDDCLRQTLLCALNLLLQINL